MTGTTPDPRHGPTVDAELGRRAGWWQALGSEWTKFYSVRSMVWTLVTVAAVTVGIAALVVLTGSLHPTDTVLAASVGNAVPGQIAAGALGALVICGEYSSGSIRATLAACPRRSTVLAAKTLLVTGLVGVVALAAAGASYLVGAARLAGAGHPAGAPLPALLGVAASYAAVAVIGLAAGTVLRHPAGAIVAVTGVVVLPSLLGPLLGGWQDRVLGSTPGGALQKLAQAGAPAPELLGGLPAWPTLGLVWGYSLAALAGAGWLLHRRDA